MCRHPRAARLDARRLQRPRTASGDSKESMMSTSAPAVARQGEAPIPAVIGLALAFAIGTASGAIAATVIVQQATSSGAPSAEIGETQQSVTSLVSKANAAATRGDARLFAETRNDLVAAVGSAEVAEQLMHLAAKADAAAARGDVRLSLQFRDEFVRLHRESR
jgi:hypothetical protein